MTGGQIGCTQLNRLFCLVCAVHRYPDRLESLCSLWVFEQIGQGQMNARTAQRTGNCVKTVQHARNTVCVADAQYITCQYTVGVFVQILFAQDKTCRMRSGNALDLGQEIALT